VVNTAGESVQNAHHWSGRTETASENRVGQVGSRCHCGATRQWYGRMCVKDCDGHFEHHLWLLSLSSWVFVTDVDDTNSYALFCRPCIL